MDSSKPSNLPSDISPREIFAFYKRRRKLLLAFFAASLVMSGIYLSITDKKFETRFQLELSRFNGQLVETPEEIVQRLKLPTAYTAEVLDQCELAGEKIFRDFLNGRLKISKDKSIASAVELTVTGSSPEKSRLCAEEIFTMIAAQQSDMIDRALIGPRLQLAQYQQSLENTLTQLGKIKNSEIGNFSYLVLQDNIAALRGKVDTIQSAILAAHTYPARLPYSMYTPNKPSSPKVLLVILLALLAGLFTGIMAALSLEIFQKFKSQEM